MRGVMTRSARFLLVLIFAMWIFLLNSPYARAEVTFLRSVTGNVLDIAISNDGNNIALIVQRISETPPKILLLKSDDKYWFEVVQPAEGTWATSVAVSDGMPTVYFSGYCRNNDVCDPEYTDSNIFQYSSVTKHIESLTAPTSGIWWNEISHHDRDLIYATAALRTGPDRTLDVLDRSSAIFRIGINQRVYQVFPTLFQEVPAAIPTSPYAILSNVRLAGQLSSSLVFSAGVKPSSEEFARRRVAWSSDVDFDKRVATYIEELYVRGENNLNASWKNRYFYLSDNELVEDLLISEVTSSFLDSSHSLVGLSQERVLISDFDDSMRHITATSGLSLSVGNVKLLSIRRGDLLSASVDTDTVLLASQENGDVWHLYLAKSLLGGVESQFIHTGEWKYD